MKIDKIVKASAEESVVLLLVPDSQIDDLAAYIHSLNMKAGSEYDNPFDTPQQTGDFENIIELIHKNASLGETMTPGKKKRVIEVLGQQRADLLFGPNYGAASWDLFIPADPLKLVRKPDGGYAQQANEKHNPAFLSALLKLPGEEPASIGPVARQPKSRKGVEVDPNWTPSEIYLLIREGSKQGNSMSPAQVGMLNRQMEGAFDHLFPGGKSGSVDLFMAVLAKRRKNEATGGWENNPNFREDAYNYILTRIREDD